MPFLIYYSHSTYRMTASSLLPVTIHQNQLYFLFGKENELEDSAKGFSDFGGGVEKNETILETALREGSEELTGFLGDSNELKSHIKNHGGTYPLVVETYHVNMFYLPYDEKLPKYYNWNHRFLWNRMNKHTLNKTKLFEKIEIQWFSTKSMKSRIREFRPFYRNIVKQILSKTSEIESFLQSCSQPVQSVRKRNHHKTKKHIPHKQNKPPATSK